MGLIVLLLALVAAPVAVADTKVTSYRDSMGYTHSDVNQDGKRTKCLTKTNSLGYTTTDCHRN